MADITGTKQSGKTLAGIRMEMRRMATTLADNGDLYGAKLVEPWRSLLCSRRGGRLNRARAWTQAVQESKMLVQALLDEGTIEMAVSGGEPLWDAIYRTRRPYGDAGMATFVKVEHG